MPGPPSLDLELRGSRRLAVAILSIHLLAAAGVVLAGLPGGFVAAVLLLLALALGYSLRRHVLLRSSGSVVRLHARPDGAMECLFRDGVWRKMRVLRSSSLFPLFAVLCLAPEGGGRGRRVAVFPDALAAEDWRRFCVWVRWVAREAPLVP